MKVIKYLITQDKSPSLFESTFDAAFDSYCLANDKRNGNIYLNDG